MGDSDSTSATIAGIVNALAPKEDDEDPMNTSMCKQVTTGSESVLTILMMHGVKYDLEKIVTTYPKCKDGCDKSLKEFIEDAQKLANRLSLFLAERNAKKKVARDVKRTGGALCRARLPATFCSFLSFQCTLSV
jgi:hypothetical protein